MRLPEATRSKPLSTNQIDLAELRDLALDVAREAAVGLQARPLNLAVDTKTTPTDVVTQMDRASEALIVERLTAARPDDGLLGEEGADRVGTSGVRWVIDPLDGTVNYLYGQSSWSVCIAAEVDGVAAVGVVVAPLLRETFVAVLGQGAYRIDEHGEHRLAVSSPPALDRALVATGFGYSVERRTSQARVLTTVLPAVRDIRRLGSAAVDLCWLASGRFDAYFERGLQPWDLAAAGVVAREAGVRVEGLRGAPAGEELVLAAAPGLFEPLHDLLVSVSADQD